MVVCAKMETGEGKIVVDLILEEVGELIGCTCVHGIIAI